MLELCRDGETNSWFSIFWAFTSDIPKATKDVNVHFSVQSNLCQSYQRISGNFEFKYNSLFKCLSVRDTQFLFKIVDNVIILVEMLGIGS